MLMGNLNLKDIIVFNIVCLLCSRPVLAAETLIKQFTAGQKETGMGTGHLDNTGVEVGLFADRNLFQAIGFIVNTVLSLLGVFFLGLTIYGGYVWMVARGNEQEAEKARDTLINAVIGLAIVVAAYALTAFVSSIFKNAV